jgi:hypothetical protein
MPRPVAASILLAVLVVVAVAGCGSTGRVGAPGRRGEGPAWVDAPSSVAGKLAGVGVYPCTLPLMESAARVLAARDGRAKLAHSLRREASSLLRSWSRRFGDLVRPDLPLLALLEGETVRRGFTDVESVGSRVADSWSDDRQVYSLVVLDRPEEWIVGLIDAFEETTLREEAVADGAGGAFRSQLEVLRREAAEMASERRYPPTAPRG